MAEFLPKHRLETAQEMHDAISRIIDKRFVDAGQSQYDVAVCVRSVDAARETFKRARLTGEAGAYGDRVLKRLYKLQDDYWDDEGEYTSKGMVGDVASDVYRLLDSQKSSKLVDIDRKEAGALLFDEINDLANLTPQPPSGLGVTTVKTDTSGVSGQQYFIKMVIEEISDERFAISGDIHHNKRYQFPILKQRVEFDVRSED